MSNIFEITHSLLYSWIYATDPDSSENAFESFLKSLNREKIPDNKAMAEGRMFEDLVNQSALGCEVDYNNENWIKAAKRFGKLTAGGCQQVYASKKVEISGMKFLLVGVADVVKAGRIFDIKKVQRYEYGKYFHSTQHPMYFELFPQSTRFDYLIFDGKMCYTETYRRVDCVDIKTTIKQFIDFLTDQNLIEIYKTKWRIK